MDKQLDERYRTLQQHLLAANNQLQEWHEQGVLTYQQYQDLVNPLLDVSQNVKPALTGEAINSALLEQTSVSIPLWLFTDETISPLAKWTYTHLLKLRREVGRPGRNALVINIALVSRDIFRTYAWTEKHLYSALEELTKKGIIESRKMDYPPTTPEHYEIGFLREELL